MADIEKERAEHKARKAKHLAGIKSRSEGKKKGRVNPYVPPKGKDEDRFIPPRSV